MKVLVIDDHLLVLEGCRHLLRIAGIEPVFLADTAVEAAAIYRRHRPEVIILDLSLESEALGGLNFLQWLRLHDRATRVIVLTMHSDPGIARRAIEAGANAFVAKDSSANELLAALDKVTAGGSYVSPHIAMDMAFDREPLDVFESLGLREFHTLRLLGAGARYEAIAAELHVSYKTVVNTVSSLKRKLGAGSLGELTRIAITGRANSPTSAMEEAS